MLHAGFNVKPPQRQGAQATARTRACRIGAAARATGRVRISRRRRVFTMQFPIPVDEKSRGAQSRSNEAMPGFVLPADVALALPPSRSEEAGATHIATSSRVRVAIVANPTESSSVSS